MLLSIIIPAYNAEKRIGKCLESTLDSSRMDYEIIVVNDGSSDNTEAICNEFAQKDERVRVITKANGGVSSARNIGLESARGTFVSFIDSDDYYDPHSIDNMLGWVSDTEADIIIFGYKESDENGKTRFVRLYMDEVCRKNGLSYFEGVCRNGENPVRCVWSCIFQKSIIMNNGIRFDSKYTWGEDFDFNLKVFDVASQIITKSDIIYNYIVNTDSTTANFKAKHVLSELKVALKWVEYCNQKGNLNNLRSHLAEYYCSAIYLIAQVKKEDRKQLIEHAQNNTKIFGYVRKGKYRLATILWRTFGIERGSTIMRRLNKSVT